jgi:hypothetical protein
MEPVYKAARLSVARGCGFALLGALTATIGLIHDPHQALLAAGAMLLIMCAILVLKAERAYGTPYRSTEAWMMIAAEVELAPEQRQLAVAMARRDALIRFARPMLYASLCCLAAAIFI